MWPAAKKLTVAFLCRTQGKARRECYDIDIEVPLRPGEDCAPQPVLDPEIDVVRLSPCSPCCLHMPCSVLLAHNVHTGSVTLGLALGLLCPSLKFLTGFASRVQLDKKIAGLLQRIEETSRRRNFFLAFSQSPVDFINALIASQVCHTNPLFLPPACPLSWVLLGVRCRRHT